MSINRSLLNWGVFLIALGGVPLAVDRGWADSTIAGDLWRLWPLILVGIGLGLILRWTAIAWLGGALVAGTFGLIFGALLAGGVSGISNACAGIGTGETTTTTRSGPFSGPTFRLDLELSCGQVNVARGQGATWQVTAVHAPDEEPTIDATDRGLSVHQGDINRDVFLFTQMTRNEWQIDVPANPVIDVDMTLNAAEGNVDLGAAALGSLSSTFNAGDVTIDLHSVTTPQPATLGMTFNASSGSLSLPNASIRGGATLNASSLDVCVPSSAQVRVQLNSTLSSDNLGDAGLTEVRDGWQTAGYDSASTRIELNITSTVSTLTLERPEVCS